MIDNATFRRTPTLAACFPSNLTSPRPVVCADVPDFDAVVHEHLDYVWRVARSFAGETLADDIAQEVFVVVGRRLSGFTGSSLRAWLYGITKNIARNLARGQRRRERRVESIPHHEPPPCGERLTHVREAALLMEQFLAQLPPPQREAFMLVELEELTAREAASVVKVPQQTVYSRLRAARAALLLFRAQLDQKVSSL